MPRPLPTITPTKDSTHAYALLSLTVLYENSLVASYPADRRRPPTSSLPRPLPRVLFQPLQEPPAHPSARIRSCPTRTTNSAVISRELEHEEGAHARTHARTHAHARTHGTHGTHARTARTPAQQNASTRMHTHARAPNHTQTRTHVHTR